MSSMFDSYPHATYPLGHPRPPPGPLGVHHALMSPPATNSSLSDSEVDEDEEERFSDDEDSPTLDVDGDIVMEEQVPGRDRTLSGENRFAAHTATGWQQPISSASTSPRPSTYGSSSHAHRRSPSRSSPHNQLHTEPAQTDYIYKPSLPAYAMSCTDTRVSTVLRPAFTQSVGRWGIRTDTRMRSS